MSGSIAASLSSDEQLLVDRVRVGAIADFSGASSKPRIHAALIRHLLMGAPVPHRLGRSHTQWPGIRIRGAHIVGALDLADCARPGAGLPTLALEHCEIPEPIDLGAARLARLSLEGSRFSFLNLREADVDGPLNVCRVQGFSDGDCWIDARSASFAGEISGDGAKLRTPSGRGNAANGDRRAALWLAGATIRGDVRLTEGFQAIGSVSLDGASVSGDVTIADATLVAGEDDAFRAQNASIGGVLLLRDFEAEGVVWLHGLRTGGMLQISDGRIYGDHPAAHGTRHAPNEEQMALIVADAEIGASMRLSPNLVADGLITFAVTKIRGYLDASGLRLSNASADGRARALDGTHADIGANLLFNSAVVAGRLDIAGARIGGRLSFAGASLNNRTTDTIGKALEAGNTTVGGNLDFGYGRYDRRRPASETGARGAHIRGTIDLTAARIGGDVAFIGNTIENPPPPPDDEQTRHIGYALAGVVEIPPQPPPESHQYLPNSMGIAVMARQVQVQSSFLLMNGFNSNGALLLNGATIGGDLMCLNAALNNPNRSALYAKDIEIGDDLRLLHTTAVGDLRFERAAINGSVTWDNLVLRAARPAARTGDAGHAQRSQPPCRRGWVRHAVRRRWTKAKTWLLRRFPVLRRRPPLAPRSASGEPPHIPRLELAHARIGTSLKCASLLQATPSRIDLTGLRVATLDLTSAHGWGRHEGAERHYPINLDLLMYERLIFPAQPTKHEPYKELRRAAGIPTRIWRLAAAPPNHLADRLLDWLLRDPGNVVVGFDRSDHVAVVPATRRDRTFFRPQPYRQLARVLRAQGYESEARYISIAEQWATPRGHVWRVLHGLYGTFFGFGLSPARALFTLFFYILIGTGLAWMALQSNLLVETPVIATSAYTTEAASPNHDRQPLAYRAFISADGRTTQADLACRDLKPVDSLVLATDTVLPFIPLHEETKCEFDPDQHLWRLCRAIYTILGWIITSLALITVSGIIKRFDRDTG